VRRHTVELRSVLAVASIESDSVHDHDRRTVLNRRRCGADVRAVVPDVRLGPVETDYFRGHLWNRVLVPKTGLEQRVVQPATRIGMPALLRLRDARSSHVKTRSRALTLSWAKRSNLLPSNLNPPRFQTYTGP